MATVERKNNIQKFPLSESSKSLINRARDLANADKHNDYISTGHLLLALIERTDIQYMLVLVNLTPEIIRPEVEKSIENTYGPKLADKEPELSPRAKIVIRKAEDEAHETLGDDAKEIRPVDIFLAIISEATSAAARVLRKKGIDEDKLDLLRSVSRNLRED